MIDDPSDPATAAAERWAEQLAAWALPARILDRADVSPWSQVVAAFATDDTLDRDTLANRWARDVLPPRGGTVLDVGCGGGRSALGLVPPATELIGVDERGAMLDEFVEAASRAHVARRTVHGRWPDVAPATPVADLVVCHHVLYNVGDVVPFLWALTDHARLAVVVEIPVRHPMSAWNEAFAHFWDLARPDGPTADDLVAVVRALGLDPEVARAPRRAVSHHSADRSHLVETARRRLCLAPDRDAELGKWLARHPPAWPDEVVVLRWPGTAEAVRDQPSA